MAREIHERENLLRDAVAFSMRVQLQVDFDNRPVEVFIGFRDGGAVSLYFGNEPVYQFNNRRQLRRAYIDGRLLKAEHGRLIAWQPQRSDTSVEMLRHEFDTSQQRQFADAMHKHLERLRDAISTKQFVAQGVVPAESGAEILERLADWLSQPLKLTIADSPGVG